MTVADLHTDPDPAAALLARLAAHAASEAAPGAASPVSVSLDFGGPDTRPPRCWTERRTRTLLFCGGEAGAVSAVAVYALSV